MSRRSHTSALMKMDLTIPDVLQQGSLNPAFFHYLSSEYREKTGYHLVFSDLTGCIQMGLPDCDKFPCMRSCKECRESIIKEALRTGKVCMDRCHEGFVLWGLPIQIEEKVLGGIVVIGANEKSAKGVSNFKAGCEELRLILRKFGLHSEQGQSMNIGGEESVRIINRETFVTLHQSLRLLFPRYLDALQTADFEIAEKVLDEIKSSIGKKSEIPVDVLKGLLTDFLFHAQQRFLDAGFDPYVCMSESGSLIEKVVEISGEDELVSVIELISQRFNLMSHQVTKDQDERLIERVIGYLEANIRERLTRESVAQGVGVSPSHLSRLLKKKKGRTFTDLLNQYRIERACKLLVRSSKSLADVANDTGFCDQSYFSKVFRNYKGVTPAEFRMEHIPQ